MAKEIVVYAGHADKTRGGELDINDLEMAGKLLAWIVLEGIVGTKNLCYKQVGLFSNNTEAVLCTQRGASKKYATVGRLLRVLDLRQRVAKASPLVAMHLTGDLNVISIIPSSTFVYPKKWYFTHDYECLSLINSKFPLPHKCSWQGFRLYFNLRTKVISKLGKKASSMGEWKRLR